MADQNSKRSLLALLASGFLLIPLLAKGSTSRFSLPIRGKVSSGFGERINPITGQKEFHNGVDIIVPEGTPVLAPEAGIVSNVYKTEAGGNQLILKHPDGYISGYAHLSNAVVKIGEKVSKHQMIALSGKTGQVTGPHLHFSLRDPSGNYIDPEGVFLFS